MAIKFLNTVQVDTDVLYVDAANNNVGIGTASPQAKLDVDGDTFLASRHAKISSNGTNVYFTAATHDASGTEGLLNKLSFKSVGTYFDNGFISITDTSVALPLDTSIVQEAISAGDNNWNVLTLPKESGTFALENWVTSNFAPSTGGSYLPLAGGTMAGTITMNNNRITSIEELRFNNGGNIGNQINTDVDTGTETVANVEIATYTAAFFDFVVKKTTNVRSGTVYACHDGTNVEFTETSTNDLGDTSDVTLSVDISGTNMRLLATVTSDDWSVKSLIRAI